MIIEKKHYLCELTNKNLSIKGIEDEKEDIFCDNDCPVRGGNG